MENVFYGSFTEDTTQMEGHTEGIPHFGFQGPPAEVSDVEVVYQAGMSAVEMPTGSWSSAIPKVPAGQYLWTRTTIVFNLVTPVTFYSVARMGLDGSGSVSSVAGVSPDPDGNVPLTAERVGAVPSTGGDLTGELRMNGQPIRGLNAPTANDQAANMGFVNQQVKKAAPRNLLDNSDFRNPVNQRGQQSYTNNTYTIDRWQIWNGSLSIGEGYITVDGVYQFLELPLDKVYTFAVCRDDGNITIVSGSPSAPVAAENDGMTINITSLSGYAEVVISGNKNVVWAALYEGEYTIDTLPEYQPKGYGAELAECMRYYQYIYRHYLVGATWSNNNFVLTIPTAPMRIKNPSISVGAGGYIAGDGSGYFDADYNISYTVENTDACGVKVAVTDTQGRFTAQKAYVFKDAYISISADL